MKKFVNDYKLILCTNTKIELGYKNTEIHKEWTKLSMIQQNTSAPKHRVDFVNKHKI